MHRVMVVVLLLGGCGDDTARKAAERAAAEQAADVERVRAEREAEAKLVVLKRDLVELDKRLEVAVDEVLAAQTENDRTGAMRRLTQLRAEKQKLEARIDGRKTPLEWKDQLEKPRRAECLSNPLAKDCE